jgi:beta-galactosidase
MTDSMMSDPWPRLKPLCRISLNALPNLLLGLSLLLGFSFGSAAEEPHHFSTAGFCSLPDSPRRVFNFNPGWRFQKADVSGAQAVEFDDSSWPGANLPHGLEILGENASGMRNYQGPAWYRKRFKLPASMQGQKIVLYFEAIMGKSEVWVNGARVASHFGGYLPIAAEIGGLLHCDDRDNVVAVLADNSDDPTYPPGKPQGLLDFTYAGGIYRDVFLIATGPVHVTLPELSQTVAGGGVFVAVTEASGRRAQIQVRTEVLNAGTTPRHITLRTLLEDANGRELARLEEGADLAVGGARQFEQPMNVTNVHLWHPDDPYLHYVRTEVLDGGKVVDSLRTRFGIRLFEMRGKDGFYVNQQPIGHKLSGANRHQDYVYVGNALPNSGQWRDAKLLRQGGCNIIRAAHYPLDPAFLDACDELGLLVTVANPGWQFFNDKEPLFARRVLADTRAMVRRDRNRPSVLLWETALNETDAQPLSMLKEMHRIVHEEFPFPGAFTATDARLAKPAGFDFYYWGGAGDSKCSFAREYGDEVDNFFSHNAMVRVNRAWGEAPLLNQALIRAHDLDEVFSTPPGQIGAALWCGIDHQRGYHPDPFWGGLLDVFRIPRYSYYLFQSQYDPGFKLEGIQTGPMVYIAHELTQISGSDVVVFSNCEEVRLTWLGKVIGTQKADVSPGHAPHPPVIFKNVFNFHELTKSWGDDNSARNIEMTAEGIIDGQVVCRQSKKYPERTSRLQLTLDDAGIGLVADGSDFVPIRATVVDNKGIPKILASEYVRFEIEGDGEIIGGEFNHANPMKTEMGTATALVRAGTHPGIIRVRASADGLTSAEEISIQAVAPDLSLLYDATYAVSAKTAAMPSRKTDPSQPSASAPAGNFQKAQEEIRRLKLEITSRDQTIMKLRGDVQQ